MLWWWLMIVDWEFHSLSVFSEESESTIALSSFPKWVYDRRFRGFSRNKKLNWRLKFIFQHLTIYKRFCLPTPTLTKGRLFMGSDGCNMDCFMNSNFCMSGTADKIKIALWNVDDFHFSPLAKLQIGDINTIIGNKLKDIILDDASCGLPLSLWHSRFSPSYVAWSELICTDWTNYCDVLLVTVMRKIQSNEKTVFLNLH